MKVKKHSEMEAFIVAFIDILGQGEELQKFPEDLEAANGFVGKKAEDAYRRTMGTVKDFHRTFTRFFEREKKRQLSVLILSTFLLCSLHKSISIFNRLLFGKFFLCLLNNFRKICTKIVQNPMPISILNYFFKTLLSRIS